MLGFTPLKKNPDIVILDIGDPEDSSASVDAFSVLAMVCANTKLCRFAELELKKSPIFDHCVPLLLVIAFIIIW